MAVQSVNLRLDKGTNFSASLSPTVSGDIAYDLSNKTPTSKLKKSPGSGIAYTFTSSVSGNTIKLSMSSTDTNNVPSGLTVYDVIVTDDTTGQITKLFDGNIHVYESTSV